MKNFYFLFLMFIASPIFSQSIAMSDSALIAMEKADKAHVLLDQEKFSEGLLIMKEAASLQPENYNYAFQVGFIYFQLKNYQESLKQLEKLVNHPSAEPELFQLLGNTHYINNDKLKAMSTFDVGLSKFPKSGLLYAEKGKHYQELDEGKALFCYEKGIELDPNFAMNYFHAALLYFKQTESIKGILHGEIFMLLNRNSNFTKAMSELLYNEYRKSIKLEKEGKALTFFCNPNQPDKSIDLNNITAHPPFCLAYASMVQESKINFQVLSMSNIYELREQILQKYYEHKLDNQYQEWAFDFQNYIQSAGHLEAYTYWLLMSGNELEFLQWKENNEEKWSSFSKWFAQHDLLIPE